MARNRGIFNFSANLEVKKNSPLDSRVVVDTLVELTSTATWADSDNKVWLYNGIVVSVIENAGLYMLTNYDPVDNALAYTDANNWVAVDASAAKIDIVDNLTSTDTNKPLSANQGKVLDEKIEGLKTSLSTVYNYKGSVADYASLPTTDLTIGDVYNVVAANDTTPAGTNYAWNGTVWDALGGSVDLSGYVESVNFDDLVDARINKLVIGTLTTFVDDTKANTADILTIKGEAETEGSIKNAIKVANDYTNTQLTGYVTTEDFESEIEATQAVVDGLKYFETVTGDTGSASAPNGAASLPIKGDGTLISTSVDTNGVKIEHKEVAAPTVTNNTATTVNLTNGGTIDLYNVASVTTDGNGHITGVEQNKQTVTLKIGTTLSDFGTGTADGSIKFTIRKEGATSDEAPEDVKVAGWDSLVNRIGTLEHDLTTLNTGVTGLTAGDDSITVAGTDSNPTVALKVNNTGTVTLTTVANNGVKADVNLENNTPDGTGGSNIAVVNDGKIDTRITINYGTLVKDSSDEYIYIERKSDNAIVASLNATEKLATAVQGSKADTALQSVSGDSGEFINITTSVKGTGTTQTITPALVIGTFGGDNGVATVAKTTAYIEEKLSWIEFN